MDGLELIRSYNQRIAAGDFVGAAEFYADDVVAHLGGRHGMSGVVEGKAAWLEFLRGLQRFDRYQVETHDLVGGQDHVVALVTLHVEREGRAASTRRVIVYHVDGERITEFWVLDFDPQALSALDGSSTE